MLQQYAGDAANVLARTCGFHTPQGLRLHSRLQLLRRRSLFDHRARGTSSCLRRPRRRWPVTPTAKGERAAAKRSASLARSLTSPSSFGAAPHSGTFPSFLGRRCGVECWPRAELNVYMKNRRKEGAGWSCLSVGRPNERDRKSARRRGALGMGLGGAFPRVAWSVVSASAALRECGTSLAA